MALSPERKTELVAAIQDHLGQAVSCPMCRRNNFQIAEGYFHYPLQDQVRNYTLGGSNVPTIAIICTHCGFVASFALGVMGFDPNTGEKKS